MLAPVAVAAFGSDTRELVAALDCAPSAPRARVSSLSVDDQALPLWVAIGDTVRLSRIWQAIGVSAPSTATSWRLDDDDVARLEGDLLVPVTAGRTRVTARSGSRTLCVSLNSLMAGVSVAAIALSPVLQPIAPGDSVRLNAALRFSDGRSLALQQAAQWTSLDPLVAEVSSSGRVVTKRDGTARVVARVGAVSDTIHIGVGQSVYAPLVPFRSDDFANSVGVNIHLSYFDRVYGSEFRTIIVPRLRELGIRNLRDGGTTLPNEDWMAEVYGRWREVADATGARFTVIMSPRRTATGPGTDYSDMSQIRELRDRIGVDRIAAWEGLNEHDLSGRPNFAQEVRESQRAIYAVVKGDAQMASRHLVVGPSIANVAQTAQIGDLSAFMDFGAIHPYDGGQMPGANLRAHVEGARPMNGSRPLQATEVGYHTAPRSTNPWHWSVSESAQAKYTLRQFLELYVAGIRRSFAYELIDQGTDPSDMEDHFGLLRIDGSRKPAFDGLRNLLALLDDRAAPSFGTHSLPVRVTGDTVGVHRLLLEKADGRRYLILWQNVRSFDEQLRQDVTVASRIVGLEFAQAVSTARLFTPLLGNTPTAVFTQIRTLSIPVPDHPVVVELVN